MWLPWVIVSRAGGRDPAFLFLDRYAIDPPTANNIAPPTLPAIAATEPLSRTVESLDFEIPSSFGEGVTDGDSDGVSDADGVVVEVTEVDGDTEGEELRVFVGDSEEVGVTDDVGVGEVEAEAERDAEGVVEGDGPGGSEDDIEGVAELVSVIDGVPETVGVIEVEGLESTVKMTWFWDGAQGLSTPS